MGTAPTNKLLNYAYDSVHEVSDVCHVEAESTLETFAYDGVGNRTTGSVYMDCSCTALNQLASLDGAGITPAYDKNGNLTKKSVTNLREAWRQSPHF